MMTSELDNRIILDDGTVVCNDRSIIEILYQDKSIDNLCAEESTDVKLYNAANSLLDGSYTPIDTVIDNKYGEQQWDQYWLTPKEYLLIDLNEYFLNKCNTDIERDRVKLELELFESHDMISVARHLIYLVDHWRSNNIVWGVGRGSSVSSFLLYLIGINRINPLGYDLDISEFLK